MPGYMMHLSEGRLMEEELKKRGYLTGGRDLALFRDGLLLPDTKLGPDKRTTHFWNDKDAGRLALAPDLSLFYARYQGRLYEPVLLGYWAHMHLDNIFVKKFWPGAFRFLDEEGKEEILRAKIRYVHLVAKNVNIPLSEFYSGEWYYGDYTRMNSFLIDTFKVTVPEVIPGCADGIDGVSEEKLHAVREELLYLAGNCREAEAALKVFSLDELLIFLKKTAADFLQLLPEKKPF